MVRRTGSVQALCFSCHFCFIDLIREDIKMKLWLELGSIILNVLIRSRAPEEKRENFIDIVNMLKDFGINEFEARDIDRAFEKIADNISISCKKVLENTNLKEERVKVIVTNINCAYKNAGLDIEKFLNMSADQNLIRKTLIKSNPMYKNDLDTKEIELYERLLEHTSHLIVNAFVKLPTFNEEGIKRLIIQMDGVVEKIDRILEQIEKVDRIVEDKSSKISNFERHYRNNIISQNNYVQLFGAGDLLSEYKRYPLSIAYVELEISNKITGKEIKLEKIFEKSKNVWISGEAGSGKTTLLQWIAVQTAEGSSKINGVRDCIPIVIHLRKGDCRHMSLKECINGVMKDSSYEIPEGWIEKVKESGRFLFLIDGFDEVSEQDRQEVLNWLQETDKKKRCKKIFTSRPQVKERPMEKDLLEIKILPMNLERIRSFIRYWHSAVLEEQLRVDKGDATSITMELCEKIGMSDALLKLSSLPLLCAMICALHYRNEMHLPTNKRELYEECCKMLLEKRDEERSIVQHQIKLSYEQKKIILAKLAYWMMKNNHVEISHEQAKRTIERAVDSMNICVAEKKTEVVFKYLLERCGILREPETGKVDFLHRTFQEYLVAYEIKREEDWGYLKEKIGDTVWQETIAICIGFAKSKIATEILEYTLQKGKKEKEEKKYLFVAIEYLNGALEVDTTVRKSIETAVAKLIPPQLKDCLELAKAGDLVVPYLKASSKYLQEERLLCLRVLRTVGTTKALEVSKTYLKQVLSKDELLEMGKLYNQFTRRDLIETGIPMAVKTYVEKICRHTIVLHNEMINVLRLLDAKHIKALSSISLKGLEIIGYDHEVYGDNLKMFENISSLVIDGDFASLNILKGMKNLKELTVYSSNRQFKIYELNKYFSVYNIESFQLVTNSQEYISGKDLAFLSKCKNLKIILLNNMSELEFEHFDELHQIRDLTIGAEYALDLNYAELPSNIENLKILIPADILHDGGYSEYVYTDISPVYFEDLDAFLEKVCWEV